MQRGKNRGDTPHAVCAFNRRSDDGVLTVTRIYTAAVVRGANCDDYLSPCNALHTRMLIAIQYLLTCIEFVANVALLAL